jgi:hypothetical protein
MSRKFLTPVNLPHGSSLPSTGTEGDLFYKTDDDKVYSYNGTAWVAVSGGEAYANIDGGTSSSVYGGVPEVDGGNASSF